MRGGVADERRQVVKVGGGDGNQRLVMMEEEASVSRGMLRLCLRTN